ncbi:branched-chain amino acid ABC transporter permease [Motilibacter deserti]|uniref:Branched-chain amino acid ABC transporter permease n=1 Tax=Motilibacter deserti TaxID=2714956 RepID=A0ABX0GR49_9ACTN|nr:branched-chain amino acid ABC transporter permease [Motilibacter deserti]
MVSNFVDLFWSSTIDGLTIGSIYALVALGYTLVYGVLRLINFAHSEIFMIGTFASVGTISLFGLSGPASGLTLVLVLFCTAAAGMAASGASAVVLERVAYRRLRTRGSSRLAALISAIGASLFLQEVFALRWSNGELHASGRDYVNSERVLEKTELFSIGDGIVRNDKLLVFVAAILMMIVLDRFVNRTRLGRGIRATAQDSESAVLMGVNINRVVVLTFLIGGAMAGLAGALYVVYFDQTRYIIGFVLGIKAFTAAVLGGIGNLRGALLGGLTIGLVENYGASIWGAEWKDVITFSILVLVLLFRPNGILGEALGRSKA